MNNSDHEEQDNELEILESIYGSDFFRLSNDWYECKIDLPNTQVRTLFLRFRLGPDVAYPSKVPPPFQLQTHFSPSWFLPSHEMILSKKLMQMFIPQQVCLYIWVEWIKEHALDLIDLTAPKETTGQTVYNQKKEDKISIRSQFSIPIHHGTPVTDRKSKFQAHLAHVENEDQISWVIEELMKEKKIFQATHNIQLYRIGAGEWQTNDDGEKGACEKLVFFLERAKITNVFLMVTRWYGGIQLGPARFKHILQVARDIVEVNKKEFY